MCQLFKQVIWFCCKRCFKGLPGIKYTYLFSCGSSLRYMVCLHLWLAGRKCIQNPVKHPMWSFLLKVNSWKRLIFFTKRTVLDVYKDPKYASVAWKEKCKFCYILQFKITCSCLLSILSPPQIAIGLRFCQNLISGPEYIIFVGMNILKTLQSLATITKRFSGK